MPTEISTKQASFIYANEADVLINLPSGTWSPSYFFYYKQRSFPFK